jgi:hypothetical protein
MILSTQDSNVALFDGDTLGSTEKHTCSEALESNTCGSEALDSDTGTVMKLLTATQ